ncbi:CHAT domain-containing protein [Polyangium sp. 6x1]|uniref:CHAT domain-containing tetratricopeptide repeat protein n=1 Tax=Polyangium sp. 6x1 TaxID=3042689 RepID=UPI00248231F5|nr:CHAT domain-containing protein [Polyangium sp. 6x1]MDI1443927.1 CHAT domain-containing protein [Polyangium sp. 6x1]
MALTFDAELLKRAWAEVAELQVEGDRLVASGKLDEANDLAGRMVAIMETALGVGPGEGVSSLHELAERFDDRGEHGPAEPLYQAALGLQVLSLGPEHPDVIQSLIRLAGFYRTTGDYQQSESLYQQALALLEKTAGPEHPAVANVLNHLAVLYEFQGEGDKAKPLVERAVSILKPRYPEERSRALEEIFVLRNEVDRLHDEGQYDAAMPLADNLLALVKSTFGPVHRHVATALTDIARLHEAKMDHAQAESTYLHALAIAEAALGPENAEFGEALYCVATFYHKIGDYAQAESLYQRAIAIVEMALGPEHPRLADLVAGLGELYKAKHEYAKAEPLFLRALPLQESKLGPEHPDIVCFLNYLAVFYSKRGMYDKAELLLQRALASSERVLGPEHAITASVLNSLALLHFDKGDYANAERLSLRTLHIAEVALGHDHPNVASALNGLALVYYKRMDYARAELLIHRGLRIREEVLGPEHPDVASSLMSLASIHQKRGEYASAELLYQRALAITTKLGPEHPDVALALHNLGFLYDLTRDYDKAKPLYQRALAIRENVFGPEHPDVGATLMLLAKAHMATGERSRALQTLARAAAIQDGHVEVMIPIGAEQQKWAYMVKMRASTDVVISFLRHFAPNDEDAKRLALTTILNRKGRVLGALTDSFSALRRHIGPADQERLDQLKSICAQYSALAWRAAGDRGLRDDQSTLRRLDEARQRLEADISRRGGELRGQRQPVTIAEVQAAIPEGAALVELFHYQTLDSNAERWVENRYVAFVLHRHGEIGWADLGEAEPIDMAVMALHASLRHPAAETKPTAREFDVMDTAVAEHRARARDLDRLLMEPIRRLLGSIHRLLLSPDGVLNFLPFGALIDEDARYLVERHALSYLTSGRDLLRIATQFESRQGPVVIAAPDYDHAAQGNSPGELSGEARDIQFRPLQFAAREGRTIAGKIPGAKLITGATATKGAFTMLAGPRILHIATHGFFVTGGPMHEAPRQGDFDADSHVADRRARPMSLIEDPLLRAGIALTGANRGPGDQDDGILTALELSLVDLTGTKLVVLSACQTGLGDLRTGDGGVYGFRHAMVMAGAETQVMSLWGVDDAATCELMEGYYEKLLAGIGRGEALRQVQIEMLGRQDRAHPYYWASFIVSGNDAPLDAIS